MDIIRHNPARLYNYDETGITIVQHKRTKILVLKDNRPVTSLQSAEEGIPCDSRHLYESNWTLDSSVTRISKKKYEIKTDG
jgi:hypothetical protein